MWHLKNFLVNKIAIPIIRHYAKDSKIIKNFQEECKISWFNGSDSVEDIGIDEYDWQKDVCKNTEDLLSLMQIQKEFNTGTSIAGQEYSIELLNKTIHQEPLSPLTLKDDEFVPANAVAHWINGKVDIRNYPTLFYNKRYPYVCKEIEGVTDAQNNSAKFSTIYDKSVLHKNITVYCNLNDKDKLIIKDENLKLWTDAFFEVNKLLWESPHNYRLKPDVVYVYNDLTEPHWKAIDLQKAAVPKTHLNYFTNANGYEVGKKYTIPTMCCFNPKDGLLFYVTLAKHIPQEFYDRFILKFTCADENEDVQKDVEILKKENIDLLLKANENKFCK